VSATIDLSQPASRIARLGSARARDRNQRVRAAVRPDTSGKLPFFCECGMEYCQSSVWLTLQEVHALMDRGQAIIGDHFFQELEARLNLHERP
jgi:hypothetical protein